jgi:putative copper resistance protein D
VGGAATNVTRILTVVVGVIVVAAATVMTWAIGFPQNPLSATLVRGVADCAAVVTLGLAVVPMLDVPRYREELLGRARTPLIIASALWVLAEIVRLLLNVAIAAGTSVPRVGARTAVEFAFATSAGRSGLVCVAAAAVCLAAAAWPRARVIAAGAAAVGLVGRTLVGHLSASPWGGIAIASHALAAAVWCGSLAALVLIVEHRGRWARVLPRFSRMSLWCVVVLTVGGIAAAAEALGSPDDLLHTGYGRIVTAKILVTLGRTAFAWRNRTWWLPSAKAHRVTARVSLLRSRIELAGMTVALTLAAGLAVTG